MFFNFFGSNISIFSTVPFIAVITAASISVATPHRPQLSMPTIDLASLTDPSDVLEAASANLSHTSDVSQSLLSMIRQRDNCDGSSCAEDIHPENATDIRLYQQAVSDPYYGYKVFMLLDKAPGNSQSRTRVRPQNVAISIPQTLYIFTREGNRISLVRTFAVSTGAETPSMVNHPNGYSYVSQRDTREGFHRVQSAQRFYKSITFQEDMPYSLWFDDEHGTAIHGTTANKCTLIGERRSMGCTRLCSGDDEEAFNIVKNIDSRFAQDYDMAIRNRVAQNNIPRIGYSPIVLLDKLNGTPYYARTRSPMLGDYTTNNQLQELPRVIRGHAAFVRIINGASLDKQSEIQNFLNNPTEGFKTYFKPLSPTLRQTLNNLSRGI